jgi:WD40 repeat protein
VTGAPESPYKGLRAFDDTDVDARLFFGRERDREIITANLLAARLTVLYGPSGVGKSSVLRAGVARQLRELAESPVVVVFSSWADAPERELAAAVAGAAGLEVDGSALDVLRETSSSGREAFLILDQAEELFLYDNAGFVAVLPELVNRPDLRVNVLLSIRDDSLARLDVFKARLPDVFGNYLRLDRLSRDAGRDAIVRPVESWRALAAGSDAVDVEPALAEAVLDEVGTGRIDAGVGGRGAAEVEAGIETPYLQLVMQRVWDEERASGSSLLRLDTFQRLGGAERIVAEHLERAVAALSARERDVAASIFNQLVTPSGMKVAHGVADLAEYANVSSEELEPVLKRLDEGRILRKAASDERGDQYEVFHDVLAGAVLGWRTRHEADRRVAHERERARRRHRRLAIAATLALVALAVMTALTVYAFSLRDEARDREAEARASALRAYSATELQRDPELSLLLALESARLRQDEVTADALRRALSRSHLRGVARIGKPITDLAAMPNGAIAIATDDGSVLRRAANGELEALVEEDKRATSWLTDNHVLTLRGRRLSVRPLAGGRPRTMVVPSGTRYVTTGPLGRRFVVAGRRGAAVLDATGQVIAALPHPARVQRAAFSPDDRLIATAGADKETRVWSESGRLLHTLRGHDGRVLDVGFSRLGSFLVTASSDNSARVWNVKTGARVSTMPLHGDFVERARFVVNEDTVITASDDGMVRSWKADTGGLRTSFVGPRQKVRAAVMLPGDTLATGGLDGMLRLWKAHLEPELVQAPREKPPRPTVDPRATIDGDVVRLRLDGREVVLEGHTDRVLSVEVSPDDRYVVTGSLDRTARVWDARTGDLERVLSGHSGVVSDASFSPDGRWIVTAGPTTAGVWLTHTGDRFYFLRQHEPPVQAATFATQDRIVTRGPDGVRAYDCAICAPLSGLMKLAERRLEGTRRTLTPEERRLYGL